MKRQTITITKKELIEVMKRFKDDKESLFYYLQGYYNIKDEEVE